jgi:RNA polymerase sigma-70 factor (ECF subfamily)
MPAMSAGATLSPDASEDAWPGLMAQAQAGDGAAYRRLLSEIAPFLRILARRYHRDARDVEDSVQDILLTVHTIRHTYDPGRPVKPWLVAIGRRRIFDRLRSQKRRGARETELTQAHETFIAAETNHSEADLDTRALGAAIEGLPPGQRQAITLMKIKEMSLKEASAVSGMSIACLKVSTHRAIQNLRQMLGKTDGNSTRIRTMNEDE